MKKTILAMLSCLVFSATGYGQSVGVGFYEDLEALPRLYENVQSYYLSSYDRTGGNDDGFNGTYSQLYVEKNGEHVIFDAKGPGCVYNFWFTGSGMKLHWGKLRFYFDEEKEARFTCEAMEFFQGQTKPFVYPLVTNAFQSSGGYSCSAPIPFAKRLKITAEKTVGFYNVYYQLYKDASVESWTETIDYIPIIQLFQRCGSDPKRVGNVKAVAKRVFLGTARGRTQPEEELIAFQQSGTIQYIKINPLYKPDTYNLNHVHLKIYYDQQDKASVDVPIGPFFGSGLGEADMRGLFTGMSSSGSYYCYFPMPFKEGIRITLQNRSHESGGRYYCEAGYLEGFPAVKKDSKVGYFGAKYNQAWPIVEEKDYVLFETQGAGAVVGQVMTVEPVKPDRKRWWEGDMRIYIDGEPKPRFHGTGHEDEYQGGWSTFWLTNPYSLPLFGEPKTENLINVFGQVNGSTTAYRFWPGKIPFQKSIRVSSEHGNHNDTPANYSSLVYYYYVPN